MTSVADQHHRASELLGAYVLHAVDPDEAQLVERHLVGCPRCDAEVNELRAVATALGNAAELPPETLWDQIAAHLGDPGTPAQAPAHQPSARFARRRSHRRAWETVGAGVAAAFVALLVVFGVSLSNANSRLGQLQAALAQGTSGAAVAALQSPGHRIVDLRSPTGATLAEVVLRRNGNGYIVSSRMAGLAHDETYQLWAKIGDRPISIGLLGARPTSGNAFSLGSDAVASELMVTVEPSGGVVTSSGPPIAAGTVSGY